MKICLVSSAGGHLTQLESIAGELKEHDCYLVTVPSPHTKETLTGLRKYFVSQVLRNPANLAVNFLQSLRVFIRERPDAIITTGAGDALSTAMIGAALGAKTIFVESYSRVKTASLFGRIARRWCDLVLLQWPGLRHDYPRGVVVAPLFDFSSIRGPVSPSPSVLVLTGTHVHGFERMLETLDRLVEAKRVPANVEAQIGHSRYSPKHFRYFRFLPHGELLRKLQSADVVVTHDGAGSIGEALSLGKPTIVVPRSHSENEVAYESGQELARQLTLMQRVVLAQTPEELPQAFEALDSLSPRGAQPVQPSVIDTVRRFLGTCDRTVQPRLSGTTGEPGPQYESRPVPGTWAHITLVSPISPWDGRPSGIRTYVEALVATLPARGASLRVVTTSPIPTRLPTGVSVLAVGDSPISSLRFLIDLALQAPRIRQEAGLVHLQRLDSVLPLLPWWPSKTKIVTLHGDAEKSVSLRKGRIQGFLFRVIETLSSLFVDRVIAVNAETMQSYAKRFPWLANKAVVIPVGAWLGNEKAQDDSRPLAANVPDDAPLVLYAGRLSVEKNIVLLLESFARLRQQMPAAFLLIVGEGPEEANLRQWIRAAGLKRCAMIPALQRQDLHQLVRRANVLAIPSLFESGPLIAVEAVCLGTPIVSTPVGRLPDILRQHDVGTLSAPDPASFTTALARVIRAGKPHYSTACQAAARSLSFDSTLTATLDVYRKLTGDSIT